MKFDIRTLVLTALLFFIIEASIDLQRPTNFSLPQERRISYIKKSAKDIKIGIEVSAKFIQSGVISIGNQIAINYQKAQEVSIKQANDARTKIGQTASDAVATASAAGTLFAEKVGLIKKEEIFIENKNEDVFNKQDLAPKLRCNVEEFANNFNGSAALVEYIDYGKEITAINPEKRWPIASISKLMAAVVASEKMDLDDQIKITETALATFGTSGDFSVNEVFRAGDLVKAALVVSSNDAVAALAEYYGNDEFVNEMQRKAREIGMYNTAYLEPTGLSYINQSTVRDLSKLAKYISEHHSELLQISQKSNVDITEAKTGKIRRLYNVDIFAGNNNFIGGKTGFIDASGRNLLAIFEENGVRILTIVLGTDDSFSATDKLIDVLRSCEKN